MNEKYHSLADWDYRVGAKIELAADQFISAPTSLRTQNIDEDYQEEFIYLGDALGHNIPEGRLITWHRSEDSTRFDFIIPFRCQDINYTDFPNECYYVQLRSNYVVLYRRGGAAPGSIKAFYLDTGLVRGQWHHIRLTFFQYIEGDLHKYLRTIVEVEIAREWVELFNWKEDGNEWADSDINRIGFRLRARPDPSYNYMDDTEIWEKV